MATSEEKNSIWVRMCNRFFNALNLELIPVSEVEFLKKQVVDYEQTVHDQKVGTKLLIMRDLELSRANQKLEQLDEAKSNFISVVAHQLRTPLSGIKWTLSMLIAGDMGELSNDQKSFLSKANESNARIIALVNDMLVADRIQSDKIQHDFKNVRIADLVNDVLFELSPQATRRGIIIEHHKDKFEEIPPIYISPEMMHAILQNLLENSIKYTMDGGKVEVDVKKEDEYLTISISDNGIGIPEDQVNNIFTKFFRARNALKQETDGSGLGLYIVKNLVEKNGGKIWFETADGKGSSFHFTIPVREKK